MNRGPVPASCAVCGAEIPPRARACPECRADERTGWREADPADGVDLPADDFDAGRFAETEWGRTPRRRGKALFWWLIAIGMLIVVVVLVLLNRFWVAP